MNENAGIRLRRFIVEYLKIDIKQFANEIDSSKQTLDHMLNNQSFTTEKVIKIMKRFPQLNIYWLLMGSGNMIYSKDEIPGIMKIETNKDEMEALKEKVKLLEENIELRKKVEELSKKDKN